MKLVETVPYIASHPLKGCNQAHTTDFRMIATINAAQNTHIRPNTLLF